MYCAACSPCNFSEVSPTNNQIGHTSFLSAAIRHKKQFNDDRFIGGTQNDTASNKFLSRARKFESRVLEAESFDHTDVFLDLLKVIQAAKTPDLGNARPSDKKKVKQKNCDILHFCLCDSAVDVGRIIMDVVLLSVSRPHCFIF